MWCGTTYLLLAAGARPEIGGETLHATVGRAMLDSDHDGHYSLHPGVCHCPP